MQDLNTTPETLPVTELPPSTEMGKLKIMHLKRYWEKCIQKRAGRLPQGALPEEWRKDTMLLSVLGLGLEQAMIKVYRDSRSFDEFENWIVEVAGEPDAGKVKRFNDLFTGSSTDNQIGNAGPDVLTQEDFDFWD